MRGRDIVFGAILVSVIFVTAVYIVATGSTHTSTPSEYGANTGHPEHSSEQMAGSSCDVNLYGEERRGAYVLLGAEHPYMVCMLNGWEIYGTEGVDLYVTGIDQLSYKREVPPKIKEGGGKGGPFTFSIVITPHEESITDELIHFKQVAAPEAQESGVTIWAYTYVTKYEDPVGAGLAYLPEGTMQYIFAIESDELDATMYIRYNHEPGDPDYHEAVEALVASAHAHTH